MPGSVRRSGIFNTGHDIMSGWSWDHTLYLFPDDLNTHALLINEPSPKLCSDLIFSFLHPAPLGWKGDSEQWVPPSSSPILCPCRMTRRGCEKRKAASPLFHPLLRAPLKCDMIFGQFWKDLLEVFLPKRFSVCRSRLAVWTCVWMALRFDRNISMSVVGLLHLHGKKSSHSAWEICDSPEQTTKMPSRLILCERAKPTVSVMKHWALSSVLANAVFRLILNLSWVVWLV